MSIATEEDTAQFIEFCKDHRDGITNECILLANNHTIDSIWKYFITTRIKMIMTVCNEINELDLSIRVKIIDFIKDNGSMKISGWEKDYNVTADYLKFIKPEYHDSAFKLVFKYDEASILRNIYGR